MTIKNQTITNHYDTPVFITNPDQSKRIVNRELGCIELELRAFTEETRRMFVDALSTGCVNYQSIEMKLTKYYKAEHGDDLYAGLILDLVRMGVNNAISEIAIKERETKKHG